MKTENDKKPEDGQDSKPADQKPPEGYSFKVNGADLLSQHEKLVALDILELAKSKGAIPGKPEDYLLNSQTTGKNYKPEDWVDFSTEKEFITLPNESTPVAGSSK